MSVNWQFFGKICIRVTPADQFNNRIRGWVYWELFPGRSVRWKNWGKIERGRWGPMGARLAGAEGDATKYRPEYSRHQIRKSSSISILNEADHMSSWNVVRNKLIVCFLIPTFFECEPFPFYLPFACDLSKLRLSRLFCVCVSLAGLGLSELSPAQVQELAALRPSDTNDILSSGLTHNLKITRQLNSEHNTVAASSPQTARTFELSGKYTLNCERID